MIPELKTLFVIRWTLHILFTQWMVLANERSLFRSKRSPDDYALEDLICVCVVHSMEEEGKFDKILEDSREMDNQLDTSDTAALSTILRSPPISLSLIDITRSSSSQTFNDWMLRESQWRDLLLFSLNSENEGTLLHASLPSLAQFVNSWHNHSPMLTFRSPLHSHQDTPNRLSSDTTPIALHDVLDRPRTQETCDTLLDMKILSEPMTLTVFTTRTVGERETNSTCSVDLRKAREAMRANHVLIVSAGAAEDLLSRAPSAPQLGPPSTRCQPVENLTARSRLSHQLSSTPILPPRPASSTPSTHPSSHELVAIDKHAEIVADMTSASMLDNAPSVSTITSPPRRMRRLAGVFCALHPPRELHHPLSLPHSRPTQPVHSPEATKSQANRPKFHSNLFRHVNLVSIASEALNTLRFGVHQHVTREVARSEDKHGRLRRCRSLPGKNEFHSDAILVARHNCDPAVRHATPQPVHTTRFEGVWDAALSVARFVSARDLGIVQHRQLHSSKDANRHPQRGERGGRYFATADHSTTAVQELQNATIADRSSVSVDVVQLAESSANVDLLATSCFSAPPSASHLPLPFSPALLRLPLSTLLTLSFSDQIAVLRHLNPTQDWTAISTTTSPSSEQKRDFTSPSSASSGTDINRWLSQHAFGSASHPDHSAVLSISCVHPHVADELATVNVETSPRPSTEDHPPSVHPTHNHATFDSTDFVHPRQSRQQQRHNRSSSMSASSRQRASIQTPSLQIHTNLSLGVICQTLTSRSRAGKNDQQIRAEHGELSAQKMIKNK
ncbi:hypothetical protein BLNAU_5505 [Blattamonas nauphoetae]|uniref:Uncharacterized protein n=1 Tax=Blattamonas nauphoetae TaxID=2049346 RepID=A0ABQ9Y6R5_9EUKA|nr:hypothetical protein BLNAU_5505 [Blattamonas nauphoetae]